MIRSKLGDFLNVTRGASLPGTNYATSGSLIRLTLGNFDMSGGWKENTSKDNIYYSGDVKPEFILKKGDLITPLTEQTPGLLGTVARIPESNKYIQSQDVGLIKCKPGKLDPSFAYYLISSKLVKTQLGAAAQQTKIRHTSPDKIKDCVVYVPEIEEQRKIGKFLDAYTFKIESNKKQIAVLESLAKTLYEYWFLQFEFPNEKGKPYRSSGGKMVLDKELKREIPEGWKVGNIYSIASYHNGLPCQKYPPNNENKKIPVVKIKEMNEGITAESEYASSDIPLIDKINTGDILFSWSASLKVQYWIGGQAALNQHIFRVIPKPKFTNEYVYQQLSAYLINFAAMANARKTTMGHITSEHMAQSRICIAPFNLIERFTNEVTPIRKMIFTLSEENERLKCMQNLILPLLLNGQAKLS